MTASSRTVFAFSLILSMSTGFSLLASSPEAPEMLLPGYQVPQQFLSIPAPPDSSSDGMPIDGGIDAGADDEIENPAAYRTYSQPWTAPAAAFRSRVLGCPAPVPMDRVCTDDFGFTANGQVIRLRWWGVLLAQAQIGRTYHIAIYNDANCTPDAMLYQTCIVPQTQFVAFNCRNQRTFRFESAIPAFPVVAGQRYWLQISEDDAASANPGADDFLWSGRQPVRGCPALWSFGNGEFTKLTDPCNQNTSDLSFEILLRTP